MKNELNISYPAIHSGTEKTEVFFIEGVPDLAKLFFSEPNEANDGRRRFFHA